VPLDDNNLLDLIYGGEGARRYTQDSPVMPAVWLHYWHRPADPADLLLTPYAENSAAALADALRRSLETDKTERHHTRLAYTETYAVARLTLDELLWAALPLSHWWQQDLLPAGTADLRGALEAGAGSRPGLPPRAERGAPRPGPGSQLEWFVDLAGVICARRLGRVDADDEDLPSREKLADALLEVLAGRDRVAEEARPLLWTVNQNREAYPAVSSSRLTVKADAAERLFRLSGRSLRWAVIDSGIDATHTAFARRDPSGALPEMDDAQGFLAHSRVAATYDFNRLRELQGPALEPSSGTTEPLPPPDVRAGVAEQLDTLQTALDSGRAVQWDLLEPLLRELHDERYNAPEHEHGTHVAGILAGEWRTTDTGTPPDRDLLGVCPDLELYDLRALGPDGLGDEFAVLAALQFVRYLNSQSDRPVIHGVNLSLSIRHDVRNYASGRTPVCDEAERLVASGVVVVAAAGNEGFVDFDARAGSSEGYRTVSITDPGNAEGIITVGATHRIKPHTYGVSYFSSRGPTGDGRSKPDLVAPGEKIEAPVPGFRSALQDGTSMAAPHVSGAAALLLARHRELIGQPARIKQILCEAATDLGRERYFQGAGLLDILRALQAV
jgi:serine protease AprX